MRSFLKILVAGSCLTLPMAAQASEDNQLWTTVGATVKLADKWRFSQEVVARFSNDRNGLYELEMNSLLGYKLTDKITLWAGYTHDPLYNAGKFTVLEHRGRQQITFDNVAKIGRGTLSLRLRGEQRWRDGVDGTAFRLRPYAKFVYPFQAGKKTALVLTHESFIDLNNTSFQTVDGLERMRNLIAITTPLAKNVTAEIGYLNQHSFRPNANDPDDHAASVSVNFSF
ncbi:MAG: DUF2490 domain-containing protein [Sphingobium sp.]